MVREFNPLGADNETTRTLPPLPSPAYADKKILLASNSPRRRELLGLIVPEFEIAPSKDIEEVFPAGLAAEDVPAYLSRLKASAYIDSLDADTLLITADTIVLLDGEILGKPKDHADAVAMVSHLAGRTHTVVTGVSLTSQAGKKSDTFAEKTSVTFCKLTAGEIEEYVNRFKPFDKAGAYGIQEWLGAAAIAGINGCFYNVMGLPLHALHTHLKTFF